MGCGRNSMKEEGDEGGGVGDIGKEGIGVGEEEDGGRGEENE